MQLAPTLLITATLISVGLAFRFSIAEFGDIKVTNSNGILQCDKIECPRNSVRCQVSKRNSNEYISKVTREIICYGASDKILQRKSWNELYMGNRRVNIQVDMYDDGRTSVLNEGNTIGIGQGFFEDINSFTKQIESYFSGFRDFFLNPFRGFL